MPEPSWLDRAKRGDANAIAHLLNPVLNPKGITVRGDRQGRSLVLWMESESPPDQNWVMHTIRRGMERLQVASVDVVHIHFSHPHQPDPVWRGEISLTDAATKADDTVTATSTAATEHPSSHPESSALNRLEQAYRTLQSDPTTPLPAIDEAYARLKTELLRQGKREAAIQLKTAHTQFKTDWQQKVSQHSASTHSSEGAEKDGSDAATLAINTLVASMRSHGLEGQARLHQSQLQIRIDPGTVHPPKQAIAILYTLLERPEFAALNVPVGAKVAIYGMASPQKIGWKRWIPMPLSATTDNRDLMSFKNSHINTFGWPILMLLGIAMNAIPLVDFLLRGIKIWFHEFGHATIAWLAGRKAIPLPFGWTNVNPERSLFVYVGLLFLFGLLFWAGRREQKRWPMVLAGVLICLQFWFTWLLSQSRFETLLSFGGIGGELYLCALLMVSFYFPLPAYWRWDIYRYPVVLGAAFTFWGQFWLWRQIQRGVEEIPWGSMWGGPSDGDMNNLTYAGWSNQQIIGTYSTLANLCLLALLGVYGYFGIRQNRHYLFALYQRWLANSSR